MWRLVVALLVTASVTGTVYAGQSDLKGMMKASIIVEGLDADSLSCGISREGLLTAVRLPIRAYTKIREADALFVDPVIYVNIITLSSQNCAHFVKIEVSQLLPVVVPHLGYSKLQEVVFWRVGSIMSGNSNYINGSVEGLAKQFATAWQGANPN